VRLRSLKALKTFCGLAAVVFVLAGCGGGSGSTSSSASASSGSSGATASSGSTTTSTSTSSSGGSSGSTPPPTNNGSATLTWTAPTANSNGSALTNLAGYYVYYGTSAGSLSNVVNISSPSTLTYVVSNLSAGTWYFAVAAYTNTGLVSAMSNVGSKTIS
jgi:hypothetical protein